MVIGASLGSSDRAVITLVAITLDCVRFSSLVAHLRDPKRRAATLRGVTLVL